MRPGGKADKDDGTSGRYGSLDVVEMTGFCDALAGSPP
jgi:hypothetical protein